MYIGLRIKYLFYLIEGVNIRFDVFTPITRRMYAMGLITDMHQIAQRLEEIDEQIGTSLSFDDASLYSFMSEREGIDCRSLLDEKMYQDDTNQDAVVNSLIDLFPLNHPDYTFTSANSETLKTGMRYLGSAANISPRDLVYALDKGIKRIFSLLHAIGQKQKKIKDSQWKSFWYEFLYRDDDLIPELVFNDYDSWSEEHDCTKSQVLEDKRTQEILKLLKSGVFNYDVNPVRRDIENRIIHISEGSLEDGMELPENIETECARLSSYVIKKKEILLLDYKKLGKYVYRHFNALKEEQMNALIYFDYILDRIHSDMAEVSPKLKPYLKFYEDDMREDILSDTLPIINQCCNLLRDSVDKEFLKTYLTDACSKEATKDEVLKKLKNQSKYTLICRMVGMLKATGKVFKEETTSAELAHALSNMIKKPKEDSLKRYIDDGASQPRLNLAKWTTLYVTDRLGSEKESAFIRAAQE